MKKVIIGAVILILLTAAAYFSYWYVPKNSRIVFGVSFNPEYAGYLQQDPKEVFSTILYDWHFKKIRLTAQWNKIEKTKGQYDFAEMDYFMNEAAKAGARVVLVVGQKAPRWPECHVPVWTKDLSEAEFYDSLYKYMAATVKQYKNHAALSVWQVENEPFLPFGAGCRVSNPAFLGQEIKLVKNLDANHKVLITDSGELSAWRRTAKAGDLFGSTMYRVVWNKYTGYFIYDWLPAWFYNLKLRLNGRANSEAVVSELQAEPWIPDRDINVTDLDTQFQSMDLARMQKNVQYAQKLNWPEAYLWGAEWWYLMKEKGHPEFGNYVAGLKK